MKLMFIYIKVAITEVCEQEPSPLFRVLSAIPYVNRPEAPPLYSLSMVPIEIKNSLYGRKLPEFQCGGSDPMVAPCIPDV